jgi:L-aspartate oxidase
MTCSATACPSTAIWKAIWQVSREAAHSENRIVRVKGDMAGRAIMEALVAAVRKTPSIRVLEGYVVEELIVEEGRCHRRAWRATRPAAGEELQRITGSPW